MKHLKQIEFLHKDGKPIEIMGETGTPISADTKSTIEFVLNNYPYESSIEVIKAFKLTSKLKVDEKKGTIALEDSEYEFVKTKVNTFKPLLNSGLRFYPFYVLFE